MSPRIGLCPCCRTTQVVTSGRLCAHTRAGRACIGEGRHPARAPHTPAQAPPEVTITPDQTTLLHLLADGRTQPQIAARLGIGQSATSLRVTALRGMLAALLQQAARQGLITADLAADLTPGLRDTRWPGLIAGIDAAIGDWLRPAGWHTPTWRVRPPAEPRPRLTPAMVEALTQAAEGLTEAEIAARGHIAPQSVHRLLWRARRALDAPTVADAVTAARHHHYLPTPTEETPHA